MTVKTEYKLLPGWYYYSKLPDFKWYEAVDKRIVKSNAAEKGSDIGYLQPGDVVWLDFSEQALGWIRVGAVSKFSEPDFVYPEWRKMLNTIQPVAEEREAWIEFDLGHIKPVDFEPIPEPEPEPEPVEDADYDMLYSVKLFGLVFAILKPLK